MFIDIFDFYSRSSKYTADSLVYNGRFAGSSDLLGKLRRQKLVISWIVELEHLDFAGLARTILTLRTTIWEILSILSVRARWTASITWLSSALVPLADVLRLLSTVASHTSRVIDGTHLSSLLSLWSTFRILIVLWVSGTGYRCRCLRFLSSDVYSKITFIFNILSL